MKKVVKLNENDLEKLVKRIIKEGSQDDVSKLKQEIEVALNQKTALPKFSSEKSKGDEYTEKTPSTKQLIARLQDILNKYKMSESYDRPRGGTLYGGKAEIIDEVINRIGQYGDEYVRALEELNSKFESTKYRRIEKPREPQIPAGVKLRSTVYPNR